MTEASLRSKVYRARKASADGSPSALPAPATREGVRQDDGGLTAFSVGKRIKSLPDLIEAFEIDLAQWRVERWKANKWEVAARVGSGDNARIVVEPLFQVEANLVNKQPEQIFLPVSPIGSFGEVQKPRKAKRAKAGRTLIIPDAQIGFRRKGLSGRLDPFHDRAAMDVVLQIAADHAFDEVIYLGDWLDLNEWSDKFIREPDFYFTTQPAIIEAHWWLRQFTGLAGKAAHRKLEGNHEARLPKMMTLHLLAAHGLASAENVSVPALSMNNLLGLDTLGVEYISGYPNNSIYVGSVKIIHGNLSRKGSTDTVRALVASAQETVIMGHIHKIEWASRTIKDRFGLRTVSAFSPGCLCRVDYVVPGHNEGQQWQQGAAVVEYDGDAFSISPIVIQGGRAIYGGKVYEARDVLPALNRDTAKVRDGWTF